MPKGYWIGQVDIIDAGPYGAYAAEAKRAVKAFGGLYLIRGGANTAFEGDWRSRHVMIVFNDYQTALDCYNSPEYQHAKTLRLGAAEAELLVIEGSDEELAVQS